MLFQDDLGRDEGREVGPQAGKGAVVYTCSGEEDFDGLPGDMLPPPKKAADRKAGSKEVVIQAGSTECCGAV